MQRIQDDEQVFPVWDSLYILHIQILVAQNVFFRKKRKAEKLRSEIPQIYSVEPNSSYTTSWLNSSDHFIISHITFANDSLYMGLNMLGIGCRIYYIQI
jgi:hypothetical protein